MAGSTLPPVVAVLQGDISDLVAKVAAAKKEVESLDGVTGTAHLEVDTTAFKADLANADAEFAAAALAMRTTADRAGGGAGNGGLLALLGWGGGMFGAAAFGSVLSLAGFGFEHLATTVLGLAGSLAGALTGAAILATGALAKMGVGMGSDMLVMLEANQAVKALVAGIEAAPSSSPAVHALAALEAGTLTLTQATLLYGKAAAQAMYQTAQLTIATDLLWLHSISGALIQISALKDSLLGLAQVYIPLVAQAATTNFTIMNQALQPLIAWASGPATTIFKNLETLFAADIPVGVDALTQFVELLAKIANFAAPQTGGFLYSLDAFLTNLNSTSGFAHLETVMTTLITMFHDWWDLLKQVGITIYDIFSQTVGLGTTIVTTVTAMLKQLDAWLTATKPGPLNNLFQAHLTEIKAILGLLPMLLSSFAQLYLMIAPDLTLIAAGLINVVSWMLKIPTVGPILAWAAAIYLLWSRMNALKLIMAGIAGFKNVLTLIQALSMGSGLKQAFSIAFGNTSAIGLNTGAVDANTGALTRLTAVMGGEGVAGGAGGAAGGAGAAGEGAAGGLLGIIGGMSATAAAGIAAVAGPLLATGLILWLNKINPNTLPQGKAGSPTPGGPGTGGALSGVAGVQAAYAATWNALLASNNAMYKNSALFGQNLATDLKAAGIPVAKIPADVSLLEAAFASGKIKTQAQLDAFIQNLGNATVATAATALSAKQMATIQAAGDKIIATSTAGIGSAFSAIGIAIQQWGHTLGLAGVSAGIALAAEDSLTAFIKIHGPLTINELAAFQSAATATHQTAAGMAQDAAALSKFVSQHGPLTAQQLQLFQNAVTASKGNGLIVQGDMAALSAFITKHGALTTQEFGIFQTAIANTTIPAGGIQSIMSTVAAYVKIHGPLTTQAFARVEAGIAAGASSAAQIDSLLASAASAIGITTSQIRNLMLQGRATAAGELAKLAGLANSNAGFSGGGIANMPVSGGLAMLHGKEMVVPYDKAGWLWPYMASAVASGKPPAFNPAPLPSARITPVSGARGAGAASLAPQYVVNVAMPQGANLTQQQVTVAVQQGLAQHDRDLLRMIGVTPRVGAMA